MKHYKEMKDVHSKNYLLEILTYYAKLRLKSGPQKMNFIMVKALSKIIH